MMDVFMILTVEMVPQKNTYIKIYQNLSKYMFQTDAAY